MPSKRYYPHSGQLRRGAEVLGVVPPEQPGRPGAFRPASTIFGTSAGAPSDQRVSAANGDHMSPDLDIYRGKSKIQLFDTFQTEFANLSGLGHSTASPLIGMFHNYDTGMTSQFSNSSVSGILQRNVSGLVSFKATKGSVAAQNHNAAIISFAKSYSGTKNLYVALNHEPSNDGDWKANPTAVSQLWRNDQARFAKLILDNRGTAPVIPVIIVINWHIHPNYKNPAANVGAATLQNPEAEMTALGVDLDDVVYSVDGYDTSPIKLGGAENLYQTSRVTRGWGFKRYAVSEGACKTYETADRALADDWIRELADVCRQFDIEFYAWFASGVGGRANQNTNVNEGWWIYGDTNKIEFARLCKGLI